VNDDELMVRVAQGDDEAFKCLVQSWEQAVYAFLARMVGSREDAEDLTQETFLRVHAQSRRYRPEGRYKSWLFRIAGNLARSHLRRRRLLRWLRFDPGLHERADTEPLVDEVIATRSRHAAVHRALAQLPDRQRQAVILSRFENMSYAEVAVAMNTTESAVDALLQRAVANLRRVMAPESEST